MQNVLHIHYTVIHIQYYYFTVFPFKRQQILTRMTKVPEAADLNSYDSGT